MMGLKMGNRSAYTLNMDGFTKFFGSLPHIKIVHVAVGGEGAVVRHFFS